MDFGEIVQYAVIVGVLLIALPFPVALVASAIAWALAGFVAVGSLWDSAEKMEADREDRGRSNG